MEAQTLILISPLAALFGSAATHRNAAQQTHALRSMLATAFA
jgi:hypothetical protein